MKDSVYVDIWTPQHYKIDILTRYPVIYMHDGQNLFDATTTWNHQSWEMDTVMCGLTSRREIEPAIIVGIHSNSKTRVADLMPVKAVAGHGMEQKVASITSSGAPVRGDEYAKFVASTLKPTIDSLYRTLPDPEHTTVMGSSMGGLMSIYILCEYPEIFGKALCLSTHWIGRPDLSDQFSGAMYDYINSHLPEPGGKIAHKLYFDHGTETVDAYYGPSEERILAMIRNKGYGNGTLLNLIDEGASHNEDAWAKRVAIPLRFILSK